MTPTQRLRSAQRILSLYTCYLSTVTGRTVGPELTAHHFRALERLTKSKKKRARRG